MDTAELINKLVDRTIDRIVQGKDNIKYNKNDDEFLDAVVFYETRGKPIEPKTFREIITICKKSDRIHFRDDHNGLFDCDRIDRFLKKNNYSISTMFGSREFKKYTVIVIK